MNTVKDPSVQPHSRQASLTLLCYGSTFILIAIYVLLFWWWGFSCRSACRCRCRCRCCRFICNFRRYIRITAVLRIKNKTTNWLLWARYMKVVLALIVHEFVSTSYPARARSLTIFWSATESPFCVLWIGPSNVSTMSDNFFANIHLVCFLVLVESVILLWWAAAICWHDCELGYWGSPSGDPFSLLGNAGPVHIYIKQNNGKRIDQSHNIHYLATQLNHRPFRHETWSWALKMRLFCLFAPASKNNPSQIIAANVCLFLPNKK